MIEATIRNLNRARSSAACALAVMICACDWRASALRVSSPARTFEPSGLPPAPRVNGANDVYVRLLIQPEHRGETSRYRRAVVATLEACADWRGPLPDRPLTVVDPPWRGDGVTDDGAIVLDRTPFWGAPTSMTPEIASARTISRWCWSDLLRAPRLPGWFVDGLSEYTARRVVASLFQPDHGGPGQAFLEWRYFGGFVPRRVSVRLSLDRDDDLSRKYRADPHVDPRAEKPTFAGTRSLVGKTLLTLAALERWLGRPSTDEVIAEFGHCCHGHQPTLDDLQAVADRVSGHDLAWLFDQTLRSSDVFDYAVDSLSSERDPDGSGAAYRTTVVVRRFGEAVFAGSSAPRVGAFESGRGIKLLVTFAGGEQWVDYWDGRDRLKMFVYRSATPATSAEVDPDRIIALDLNRTNNSRALNVRAGAAATRWAARWAIWLQDLLLTYAALL